MRRAIAALLLVFVVAGCSVESFEDGSAVMTIGDLRVSGCVRPWMGCER